MALLSVLTAYLDYVAPQAHLAPLAFLYVIIFEAIGGLASGLVGAVSLALLFTAADYWASPLTQQGVVLPNAIARLCVFLITVALVEAVRRQSKALNEMQLHRQELELGLYKGQLAEADARFYAVGESLPFGIWHCNAEGRVTYMSPSFLQLVGMTLEEARQGGWVSRVAPEDAERIQTAWANRENWGEVWEDEYRVRGVDGKTYFILCRGRAVRDKSGLLLGWAGLNLDLTARLQAREQLRFLVEAGRVLSLSLDPSTTLERVANLTVPRLADWCAVELVQENGELQSLVMLHSDPTKIGLARELRGYPADTDDSRGVRKVLRTGQSELYEEISDELMQQAAQDERHLELLRQVGFTSALIVPMKARERILGAMTLAHAESGRKYTQDDVRFVEILAARAALAYDNARNYAKEQRVADAFQRASLPMFLPRLPGIRLHATYLPGANESEIGGDWYDAFQLPDGKLAISIGDVAGKGLRAAVSMASARQAVRNCALEGASPQEALVRVNRSLTYESTGMVTAVFGILDPVTLQFTFASAGHPAPMLGSPGGRIEKLTTLGLPLGLFPDSTYHEATVTLEPGSLLVLYTDGLIEVGRNVIDGEQVLMSAVAGEMQLQTPDPSAAIVRRVILGAPKDDVALLTVSVSSHALDHVDLTTQASPANARVLRQALRRLALSMGLDDKRTFNLLAATGEAISNVIEHAYGIGEGVLHLHASRHDDELVVKVKDHGTWRPRQPGTSGRGLVIMRALTDQLQVDHGNEGTTVCFHIPLSERVHDGPSHLSSTER